MSARDEAVRLLADAGLVSEPRVMSDGVVSLCIRTDAEAAERAVDVLAAAGLLRPDPTGEDREALRSSLMRAMLGTTDGGWLSADDEIPAGEMARLAAEWLDAFLASRPRGPETEPGSRPCKTLRDTGTCEQAHDGYGRHVAWTAPTVTPEQVKAASRRALDTPGDYPGEDDQPGPVEWWAWRITEALAALGIEVRAGEPR